MQDDQQKSTVRRWVNWVIVVVWIGTISAALITLNIHPATAVTASLTVRRFSFRTNANHILGAGTEEQLLVSGVRSLEIHLNHPQRVSINGAQQQATQIEIVGEPFSTCTFYQVRSDGFDLSGPSTLIMEWDSDAKVNPSIARSFSLSGHGSLSGNLASQPAASGRTPAFTCTNVRVNGKPPGDTESRLSTDGGDSIFLTTAVDSRIDFDLTPQSTIGDTQIPVLGELRFWQVEPGSEDTKTVLLGSENKVLFEKVNQSFTLDEADLLLLIPKSDFYLRRFSVKDGIQLNLHGIVREVKAGPGAGALDGHMPSLFAHMGRIAPVWGTVLTAVTLILGILSRLGWVGDK
jgi:hypothetical protein